ncbi:MAG: ATP-binding cassette domain-containing protein [Planctomycetota bacterium]|nr:ATP-binding cassette domain-containing protein [Planctomycetota bacterium]
MNPTITNSKNEPAVILRGVAKRFGAVQAVRHLDLEVERGSLVGLLGPNGAGKSTAIRMIMSLIRQDSGELRVLGGDALDVKDRIGYLPEERGLYRRMRVGEFLFYLGRLKGLPRQGLNSRVESWLERIELPGVFRSRCQELSKGMQQKVQFIGAVLHEPDLIVLDEPFSGLDPVNARVLISVVQDLHREGRTIFLSTHQMAQAEQLCERVVLINRGEKILDSTTQEVTQRFSPRAVEIEPLAGIHAARSALEAIPGIESVQTAEDGRTAVMLVNDQTDLHAVMSLALAAVPCRRIEIARVSLDDVFVRLVTEHGGHARQPVRGAA